MLCTCIYNNEWLLQWHLFEKKSRQLCITRIKPLVHCTVANTINPLTLWITTLHRTELLLKCKCLRFNENLGSYFIQNETTGSSSSALAGTHSSIFAYKKLYYHTKLHDFLPCSFNILCLSKF